MSHLSAQDLTRRESSAPSMCHRTVPSTSCWLGCPAASTPEPVPASPLGAQGAQSTGTCRPPDPPWIQQPRPLAPHKPGPLLGRGDPRARGRRGPGHMDHHPPTCRRSPGSSEKATTHLSQRRPAGPSSLPQPAPALAAHTPQLRRLQLQQPAALQVATDADADADAAAAAACCSGARR